MSYTVYCKKCGRDMPLTDLCPRCGAKLGKNAARVAWCVDHAPVSDWMSWNAAMRILLPLSCVVIALVLVLEGLMGGLAAVEELLRGGLMFTVAGLLFAAFAVLLLVFILQGEDVLDCVADSRGVHVQQYLPDPTPLKLLLRLRSPALMKQIDPEDEVPMVLIGQRELAWRSVARVQLWPEKNMVLFYSPAWWLRVYLPCSPFSYPDVLDYTREKLGAKRAVILPAQLRKEH